MLHLLRFLSLTAALCLVLVATPVQAASVQTQDNWVPEANDVLIVDVQSNTAYLLHQDARYLPFLVATGMKRKVHYLNHSYYAQTPTGTWVARERKIQLHKRDFGPTGRFLRLFQNGTLRTAYGIHSHKDIEQWMQRGDRYTSLGCIVVSEQMLDIIERTYEIGGNRLVVITTLGPERFLQELTVREQTALWNPVWQSWGI